MFAGFKFSGCVVGDFLDLKKAFVPRGSSWKRWGGMQDQHDDKHSMPVQHEDKKYDAKKMPTDAHYDANKMSKEHDCSMGGTQCDAKKMPTEHKDSTGDNKFKPPTDTTPHEAPPKLPPGSGVSGPTCSSLY